MDVGGIVLGEEEIIKICGILDILLRNDVTKSEFQAKFPWLVTTMCNFGWKIKWIQRLFCSGQLSLAEAFQQILRNWVEWNKEKATLENLLSLFHSFELDTFAGLISNELSPSSIPECVISHEDHTPSFTLNPVEKALGNPVVKMINNYYALFKSPILTEIFTKLNFQDRKRFRLVNRLWMTETLTSWRKTSCLVICGDKPTSWEEGLTMGKFVQTFKDESLPGNSYSLIKPPYRRVLLFEQLIRPFHNGITEEEDFFWKLVAPNLTHLSLFECGFYDKSLLNTLKWILLKICPNLMEIDIFASSLTECTPPSEIAAAPMATFPATCDLKTLKLYPSEDEVIKVDLLVKILQMTPHLKTLNAYSTNDIIINALLQPTNNGKYMSLEKLILWDNHRDEVCQLALLNYTEKIGNPLKELQTSLMITGYEHSNFHIYAALEKCAKLEILKIRSHMQYHLNVESTRFFNLGNITFSELKELHVDITTKEGAFDFGSLRNLPQLMTLIIAYGTENIMLPSVNIPGNDVPGSAEAWNRTVGSGDWMNEGALIQYTPHGMQKLLQNVEQLPLKCESLQRFTFNGWLLNLADVELLRDWFPRLTFIHAKFSSAVLPFVFDYWTNIRTVSLAMGSQICQQRLELVKRENEFVKIIVPRNLCNN